jgi:poly [ADP-ribose] polymerase 7/11/12/13
MPTGTEVELVKLMKGSQEYNSVISKVDLRFGSGPEKVVRVQNPYLWGCYLLKKAECVERSGCSVTEKVLFHATGQSNIDSITKNNLDWRRSFRTKFGRGVSFSTSATYANTWCNRDIGSNRALIVARVLVGSSHDGGYGTELPRAGYDTTVGNREQVYVKYSDHEFYPEYVIYYSNGSVY